MKFGEVGDRIKKCRETQGYTREKFAELIDVTPRFVYDVEMGNKGMSMGTLIKVGSVLNVPVDYILLGRDAKNMPIDPDTLALIQRCPDSKIDYLNDIIKSFVLAIDENKKKPPLNN